MKKAIVTANRGFQSRRMSFVEAVQYARVLTDLGNVDVKVVFV